MSNELITQLRAMQEREYDTFGDIGDTTAGRAADALERLEGKIADAAHLVKTGGIEICRERQRAEAAEARVKELELKLVRQDEVAREACEAAVWKYGQERMELEARVAELEAWKASALAVEKEWDAQEVGKLLGLTLGTRIRAGIAPAIKNLQAQNARLRAALEEMVASMVKYEMDVDDGLEFGPPRRHREMMRRAQAALNGEEAST